MRVAQSFFVALMLALAAPTALTQSNGAISGQVTDSSKAPVPEAKVLVTSVETGVQRATTTNGEGEYTVPSLTPGNYIVTAELSGFKRSMSAPLKLDTTATARVDLVLSLQESKVAVEVTATAPALQTESSMTGGTVSGKELSDLPLQGRNSLELALTVAGVSGEMGADEAGISYNIPSAGSGLTVSGGRAGTSSIMADGANATSIGYGRATVTFSPDTIQEFRVITSTFSAQYGVIGGGVISTVSKSGTDEIHGDAFWFNRNPMFTARTFGQPFPSALRRNEVGVTLGGPFVIPKLYNGKRKTFFFVSYEAKRRRDETSELARLPTLAERQGDFRNTWVGTGQTIPLLYQQVACSPGGCDQLQQVQRSSDPNVPYQLFSANDPDPSRRGHVIPDVFISPMARILLKDLPLPNMPYDFFGRNFLGASGVTGSDNRWSIKIDHNFSSKQRFSARYTDIPNLSDRYKLTRNTYPGWSAPGERSVTRQGFISDSYVISPHTVNEFRGSYTYSDYSRTLSSLVTHNYTRDLFGLPSATDTGYPRFQPNVPTMPNFGVQTGPMHSIENQYQVSDDMTRALGRHVIISGVDLRYMQSNVVAAGNSNLEACCGIYVFNTGVTDSGNARTPGGPGGFGFASFLLGVPVQTIVAGTALPYYYRYRTIAAYTQDDFKVRPSLTLNLGVRWQYVSPRAEKYNRQASLDLDHPFPVTNPNGSKSYAFNYVFSGDASGSRYLEPTHKLDFEPRLGFAWTPHFFHWNNRNSFVVRGGYGISHIAATATGRDPQPAFSAGNPGNFSYLQWGANTTTRPRSGGVDPNYLISLGRNNPSVFRDPTASQIPSNGLLCQGCPIRDPRLPGNAMTFVKSNKSPYIQTWNLTMQSSLGHDLVATLTYLGQKGTHLPSARFNLNNPDPEKFAALLDQGGDPTQAVPDPYGRTDARGNPLSVFMQDLMRPYPLLGDVFVLGITNNDGNYHAGTVELERRFKAGLGFRFNYTLSKSIDNGSDGMGDMTNQFNWGYSLLQDPTNPRGNRSVSNYDSRHRFNLTLNADVPLGKGRRLLDRGGWTNVLVGGWSFNATGSLYSGYPFAPQLGDANGVPGAQNAWLALRPSLVPGVPLKNPRWTREHAFDVPYFNPEAFARPAYGQIGNAPRTMDNLRGPWRPGLNLSVFKSFYPFENSRRYVEFRGEFFNALNHTWFTMNPNSSVKVFNSQPPISRTGLSLAGPIPYLVGSVPQYPVGSRENIIANNYNYNFGVFNKDNNNPGRIIQLAVKIFW
jgi:Carboxypeptidase regulatory-like domain